MAGTNPNLSTEKIRIARKTGRLTFKPVAGNRLVCVIAPECGHLNARQATALRRQVWPKMNAEKAKSLRAKVFYDQRNLRNNYQATTRAFCTNCGQTHRNVEPGTSTECSCGKTLKFC